MKTKENVEMTLFDSETSNFIKSNDIIAEGDTIIIYLNHMMQYVIVVKVGCTFNMKYGALRHEFLIGKRYGTKISASKGYIYPLRINSQYWTRTLSRQTQILYTPDIGTILLLLDARPGSIICESGTGSGSLSHAIATAIAPSGHLYSHDVNESRVRYVQQDLEKHGMDFCTVVLKDVCQEGFFVEDACDSVFLDLPEPWRAIPHAKRAISKARGGRIVNFSPCIEQVQKTCIELETNGFIQIEVIEVIPRKLKVTSAEKESLEELVRQCVPIMKHDKSGNIKAQSNQRMDKNRKRQRSPQLSSDKTDSSILIQQKSQKWMPDMTPFPSNQPTHTGYLVAATLLPLMSLSI